MVGVNRSPDNHSGMSVRNAGAIQRVFFSGMFGDVGNPELVGSGATKITIG